MELTKEQEKDLEEIMQNISKALIATMNVLDLKTHIEMISELDGYKYKLRFDKEKL